MCSGAGTIFGQETESAKVRNAKYRSSLELERFLSRKEAFSKKNKGLRRVRSVFLS